MRASPLRTPTSTDTLEWRRYQFELGTLFSATASLDSAASCWRTRSRLGAKDADSVRKWIGDWQNQRSFHKKFILLSPTSDRLAQTLVSSLRKREPGSMKGLHLVFVGTVAEGKRVSEAAARAGAKLTAVDPRETLSPRASRCHPRRRNTSDAAVNCRGT
jgi:hypothetical protein